MKLPSFTQSVPREDGRPEEGADEQNLRVADLMFEVHQGHRGSLSLRQIDCAMANVAQATSAPLRFIWSV
jgi:hypothetical protein